MMSLTKQNHEYHFHEMAGIEAPMQEPNPKYEIIGKLIDRSLPMSYSKLKYLDSPVNFINNLLKPKEMSESMLFGSVVDCLLLEEHKFDKKFSVINATPTTENQKEFVKNFLENPYQIDTFEERVEDAYSKSYKTGTPEKNVSHLYSYLQAIQSGKEAVSQEVYDHAKAIAENLKNTPEVADELMLCEEFQKFIEFEWMGWSFRGILDTFSPNLFHDLKFASDCNPEKFTRDVEKFGYDIQFGLYRIGLEILGLATNPKFKYIVFDKNFNSTIIEVDDSYLLYGERKVEHYLKRLNKMVDERAFGRSYDYFKKHNIMYKPKWIAGLDDTIFEH
ncbi:PD-(D/E)XK nuclease-like domain-containing protein [Bergeyella zoohelcum]|uniref:PD-(D/E)XK nuclease-like domain-containing protein n=1 Tax=Bergeyella zoohelcum TaxID=1015 RepID=UPI003736865B